MNPGCKYDGILRFVLDCMGFLLGNLTRHRRNEKAHSLLTIRLNCTALFLESFCKG